MKKSKVKAEFKQLPLWAQMDEYVVKFTGIDASFREAVLGARSIEQVKLLRCEAANVMAEDEE